MTEKIFISYASEDREYLEALEQALREHGIIKGEDFSFIDSFNFSPGEDFRESIKKQIQSASKVVIIATDESASSKWVNYEAGMADALDKPIIVVVPKGFRKSKLLSNLSKFQSIEFNKIIKK